MSFEVKVPVAWPLGAPQLQYEVLSIDIYEKLAVELVQAQPHRFRFHKSSWGKFPDGTDNIELGGFTPVNLIRRRHVLFLSSFHTNDVCLQQFHAYIALLQSFIESLTIVLPFYPTATMERVTKEGIIATANTVAQLFCGLPSCGKPVRLLIYDLHTLQNRFYFNDSCITVTASTVPLMCKELPRTPIDCIAFPDDGAHKRFAALFQGYDNTIVCAKKRDGDSRKVYIHEGDAKGHHVLLVDDLVRSGGTLIEAAKVMKEAGALSVSVFCAHSVFPQQSWKLFTEGVGKDLIDKFYTTNSVPHVIDEIFAKGGQAAKNKFVVFDLAPQILEDL